MRKIKQEDARINMRRNQLMKQAERIAQARAKAAAQREAAMAPAPAPAPAPSPAPTADANAAPADGSATPKTNGLAAPSLHPSLPAKPGASPGPSDGAPASSPARVETPNPPGTPNPSTAAPPAAAPPAPAPAPAPAPEPAPVLVLPPDAQIDKFEEVSPFCFPRGGASAPCADRAIFFPPYAYRSVHHPRSSRPRAQNKLRTTWLALRAAREQHLGLLGKIGMGDVVLLEQEIEKEKVAAEVAALAATQASASPALMPSDGKGHAGVSQEPETAPSQEGEAPQEAEPEASQGTEPSAAQEPGPESSQEAASGASQETVKDEEGDVKMEAA